MTPASTCGAPGTYVRNGPGTAEPVPGPYPIPARLKIEGASGRHLIVVDQSSCRLHELYAASRVGTRWTAGFGAIWNLASNAFRPAGWTSADAAGLPILPGLARHDEGARGELLHALRFTAPVTRRAYIYPARHRTGSTNSAAAPPVGLRIRLKRSVSPAGISRQARVILVALQTDGMILAEQWELAVCQRLPDPRWNDDHLHQLARLTGADLEVVNGGSLRSR